jgi:hypothetical protein
LTYAVQLAYFPPSLSCGFASEFTPDDERIFLDRRS